MDISTFVRVKVISVIGKVWRHSAYLSTSWRLHNDSCHLA